MRFEQAKPFLNAGLIARRTDWHYSAAIRFTPDSQFGTLYSNHGIKPWQPYWLDFFADDWEILGCQSVDGVRKLLTKTLREATNISA